MSYSMSSVIIMLVVVTVHVELDIVNVYVPYVLHSPLLRPTYVRTTSIEIVPYSS